MFTSYENYITLTYRARLQHILGKFLVFGDFRQTISHKIEGESSLRVNTWSIQLLSESSRACMAVISSSSSSSSETAAEGPGSRDVLGMELAPLSTPLVISNITLSTCARRYSIEKLRKIDLICFHIQRCGHIQEL